MSWLFPFGLLANSSSQFSNINFELLQYLSLLIHPRWPRREIVSSAGVIYPGNQVWKGQIPSARRLYFMWSGRKSILSGHRVGYILLFMDFKVSGCDRPDLVISRETSSFSAKRMTNYYCNKWRTRNSIVNSVSFIDVESTLDGNGSGLMFDAGLAAYNGAKRKERKQREKSYRNLAETSNKAIWINAGKFSFLAIGGGIASRLPEIDSGIRLSTIPGWSILCFDNWTCFIGFCNKIETGFKDKRKRITNVFTNCRFLTSDYGGY